VRKTLWVTVFAIAMALVEAAILVYLRAIYYPDGSDQRSTSLEKS